jgi:hypothetical protein
MKTPSFYPRRPASRHAAASLQVGRSSSSHPEIPVSFEFSEVGVNQKICGICVICGSRVLVSIAA